MTGRGGEGPPCPHIRRIISSLTGGGGDTDGTSDRVSTSVCEEERQCTLKFMQYTCTSVLQSEYNAHIHCICVGLI